MPVVMQLELGCKAKNESNTLRFSKKIACWEKGDQSARKGDVAARKVEARGD